MEDFASRSHGCARTIFTIGHSTRTLAQLIALLREPRIELLVDVRSVPRSRTNPQFNIDIFPEALAAAGVGYRPDKNDKNDKKFCYINDLTVAVLAVCSELLSVIKFPDHWENRGNFADIETIAHVGPRRKPTDLRGNSLKAKQGIFFS